MRRNEKREQGAPLNVLNVREQTPSEEDERPAKKTQEKGDEGKPNEKAKQIPAKKYDDQNKHQSRNAGQEWHQLHITSSQHTEEGRRSNTQLMKETREIESRKNENLGVDDAPENRNCSL
jgi:hypothetical protein